MLRPMLSVLVMMTLVSVSQAGPLKKLFGRERPACSSGNCGQLQYEQFSHATQTVQSSTTTTATTASATITTAVVQDGSDALDEVNAKRAERGLRPFVKDPLLTTAALSTAQFRAAHRLFGHTTNDFAFLPPGSFARAAGCAAWPSGMGWGSCCTYENHTYAGAAWAYGADGKRYMHLFVR